MNEGWDVITNEGYGLGIDVDFTGYPVNRIDLNPIHL